MSLEKLNQIINFCQKCHLSKTRTKVVPGEGNTTAEIMFIGEAPGKNEDLQGRPFVGATGKLLNELIASIGLQRKDIYIANVVKCRPPNNRDPLPEEIQACWPYLENQIKLIKPKLIVTLGRHSMARFYPQGRISVDHGRILRRTIIPFGKIVFFPCYHPAAALYNRSLREIIFKDFKKIPKILKLINEK